ncbi:hypothetical protein IJF81_03495 [bacterium]|nr:hypothetical protein [bacterium]
MKVVKIFRRLFEHQQTKTSIKNTPPCPIIYDRNNVTAEEFRKYIHWLSENNINRTIQEPDRFVTKAERAILEKKKLELEEYRNFVKYLSKNSINRTFYC